MKKNRKRDKREEGSEKAAVCPVCGRPLDDDSIEGCAYCNGGDEVVTDYSVGDFIDVP